MTGTQDWWRQPIKPLHETVRQQAEQRQATLTKPPGSLGRLEELALWLAAVQGREKPQIHQPWISIFAGDHGVVAEGVAAYPQAVTQQMLANFTHGGAAIAVLARHLGATLEVVDAGTLAPAPLPGVVWAKAGFGTANLAREAAMTQAQCETALEIGREAVARAQAAGADVFIGGEMGIGNTTSAAALACALLGQPGVAMAGPGTGLNAEGVQGKAAVIDRALRLHSKNLHAPEDALRCVGGFEIAALVGAYIACAQAALPALVDGFIATSAALVACHMNPGVRPYLCFSHASAEPGHVRMLEALAAAPLLNLGLRLGEGSGAAAALPLLRMACALHAEMATFAEAGVSVSQTDHA